MQKQLKFKFDNTTMEATVIGFDEGIATAIIPTEVNGYKVTSIGYSAFEGCESLTSIAIPDSVTSIGNWAFFDCESLTSIDVSENNQNYCSENGILFNKDKTELIQYPIGKTDASYKIPDSVTDIGYYAFCNCNSLTSVTIPDSETKIESYAFSRCKSLTTATIPDSAIIGNYVFSRCKSLTTATIPDRMVYRHAEIFKGCDNLKTITTTSGKTIMNESYRGKRLKEFSRRVAMADSVLDMQSDNDGQFDDVQSSK